MKLRSTLSRTAAVLLSVSVLALGALSAGAQVLTGKIHGRVTDPTGMPKNTGSVSLSGDMGHTMKYTFQVTSTGDFTGADVAPGTYTLVFRMPDTPAGQFVDQIETVKIVAGADTAQDVDMSRKEYIDKLTPELRKQVEEFKKKNAEVSKTNQVIKTLNADLAAARNANHDKKYEDAEALMLKDTAIVPLPPQGETLWYELGMAQLGLKKWDDASVSLKKTLEVSAASKKPSPELIAGAHAALGEVLARSNKPDDAATEYDTAAKTFPAKAAFYLGNETVVFSQVGNSDAQAAAADKAIAADPKNAIQYYLKGQALAGKITVDSKTGAYITPPGMLEAYNKYLELAPTGQFVADVKALIAATSTKVETKFKAKK